MKNIGTLALTKLLNLVRGELNKKPDQEISDTEVSQLFKSVGGIGYAGANTSTDAPVGTIITYMGVKPPLGYLICDGSEYRIDQYPALVKHFEEQFGECNYFGGNGEDTFCVPDMNGRFMLNQSDQYPIGDVGGEAKHTLYTSELPKHTHAMVIRFDNGSYDIASGHANAGLDFTNYSDSNRIYNQMFVGSSVGTKKYHEATYSPISYQGSNAPHNNMPPYMVVCYCIKACPVIENTTYMMDETIIGTWVDGLPIYRRIIKIDNAATVNTIISMPFDFDYEIIVNLTGCCNGRYGIRANYFVATNDQFRVWYDAKERQLRYIIGSPQVNSEIFIILEYTKKGAGS